MGWYVGEVKHVLVVCGGETSSRMVLRGMLYVGDVRGMFLFDVVWELLFRVSLLFGDVSSFVGCCKGLNLEVLCVVNDFHLGLLCK